MRQSISISEGEFRNSSAARSRRTDTERQQIGARRALEPSYSIQTLKLQRHRPHVHRAHRQLEQATSGPSATTPPIRRPMSRLCRKRLEFPTPFGIRFGATATRASAAALYGEEVEKALGGARVLHHLRSSQSQASVRQLDAVGPCLAPSEP
jgi:hypothetical protein